MNKFISRPLVGALALLGFAGAAHAATVTVTAYDATDTTPTNTFNVGDEIVLRFQASGYPAYSKATLSGGIVGASLTVNFGSQVKVYGGDGSVPVSYDVDPCAVTCATKYGFYQAPGSPLSTTYNFTTFVSGNVGNALLASGNPTGTSVALWEMRFIAAAPGTTTINAGEILASGICLVPAEGGCMSASNVYGATVYNGASITVNGVPVPAAAWLFGSALGLLGVARRRSA